jgi:hypothetical protein
MILMLIPIVLAGAASRNDGFHQDGPNHVVIVMMILPCMVEQYL